jgi:hypothetical protein
MLMGRRAEDSWARFRKRYPTASGSYTVVPSLHPSGRGITRGGQTSRGLGSLAWLAGGLDRDERITSVDELAPAGAVVAQVVSVGTRSALAI